MISFFRLSASDSRARKSYQSWTWWHSGTVLWGGFKTKSAWSSMGPRWKICPDKFQALNPSSQSERCWALHLQRGQWTRPGTASSNYKAYPWEIWLGNEFPVLKLQLYSRDYISLSCLTFITSMLIIASSINVKTDKDLLRFHWARACQMNGSKFEYWIIEP